MSDKIRDQVRELWPELSWIEDDTLRKATEDTWVLALSQSKLDPKDLNEIPFTLLVPDCPVTFMEHKRAVVHISLESARKIREFFGDNLPVDLDTVVAGAILADVGKVLEYDKKDGKAVVSDYGRYLRHPFSGVGVAMQCNVPESVCHIIAAHAGEGDMVRRTTEAYIVHHADFMTFLPFKNRF